MSGVQLKSVRKTYPNGAEAIRGVDMDIKSGEMIVFVGPSGCGKSTLLRMVAGLESISGGDISIGDRVINDVSPSERDVAMVFQNYALYPHMSVRGNMSYGLKNRKMDKAEIEKRVNEAASMLKIDQFLDPSPINCPAGSGSASPWAVRLCATRRSSCLMNHCRTLMPSCACRCGSRLSGCNGA